MKALEFVSARDSEHAVALIAQHGPSVKILAGGTDLLVEFKHEVHDADVVVDITRAADLNRIEVTDAGLSIGAMVTHTAIMQSPVIQELFPALVEAAHTIGAVQTRNLGTLGGNLVTCVPSLDSGPVLVALDAEVTVAGVGGRRRMPLTEFMVGPRKTVLEKGEILVDIIIPRANLGKPCSFRKFGLRKGQALALVNAAAAVNLDQVFNRLAHLSVIVGPNTGYSINSPPSDADHRQGSVAIIKLPGLIRVKQITHKMPDNHSIQLLCVYQVVEDVGLSVENLGIVHIIAIKTDGIDLAFPGHIGDTAPYQVMEGLTAIRG